MAAKRERGYVYFSTLPRKEFEGIERNYILNKEFDKMLNCEYCYVQGDRKNNIIYFLGVRKRRKMSYKRGYFEVRFLNLWTIIVF